MADDAEPPPPGGADGAPVAGLVADDAPPPELVETHAEEPEPAAEPWSPLLEVAPDLAPAPASSLTFDELVDVSGLTAAQLREVERYGLVVSRPVGRTSYYDEEALVIARLVAGFLRFGIEPRHVRMYRTSAEREAGVFEQVILPLVKQRNPQARAQALASLVGADPARFRDARRDDAPGSQELHGQPVGPGPDARPRGPRATIRSWCRWSSSGSGWSCRPTPPS